MTPGRNFPSANNKDIWKHSKNVTGQGDDYTTTAYLLDYPYFKENYKLIALDLIKKQALDADPKAMQQIKVTGTTRKSRKNNIVFYSWRNKRNDFGFFASYCESIVSLLSFTLISI